jgi:hypothetical protein
LLFQAINRLIASLADAERMWVTVTGVKRNHLTFIVEYDRQKIDNDFADQLNRRGQ